MSVLEKGGKIFDFIQVFDQIASDGYGFLTHTNCAGKIKVQMQLIESPFGIRLTNTTEVDITPLRKGLKKSPYINFEDSKGKRICLKLNEQNFLVIADDSQIFFKQGSINLTIDQPMMVGGE